MNVHDEHVVAVVRVCIKPGRAIAVCEFPPILELGDSEADVIDAVRRRLRAIIAKDAGSVFAVRVENGVDVDVRTGFFR
jgi:hypothetical protein